ncbi:thioredoxin family protein [Enterococcus sp. AZ103]|uniref:thioredoxin family protein n=1 Tax=Enterococcus sp. AZ103 TaxID=2774628 RepID=UPI003F6827D3
MNGERISNQMETQQAISPKVAEKQILFFYRPDCGDCQKILPMITRHSLFNRNVTYINMNIKQNRKYIQTYHLTQVPTFINGDNRYEGINKDQIKNILSEESP